MRGEPADAEGGCTPAGTVLIGATAAAHLLTLSAAGVDAWFRGPDPLFVPFLLLALAPAWSDLLLGLLGHRLGGAADLAPARVQGIGTVAFLALFGPVQGAALILPLRMHARAGSETEDRPPRGPRAGP